MCITKIDFNINWKKLIFPRRYSESGWENSAKLQNFASRRRIILSLSLRVHRERTWMFLQKGMKEEKFRYLLDADGRRFQTTNNIFMAQFVYDGDD